MTNLNSLNPENLEFHASCGEGLHDFLQEEIQDFQLNILNINRGGVFFKGKKENLFKFFLSTRFSSKLSFNFLRFKVQNADELYTKALRFEWENLFAENLSFKIESFTKDNLQHSQYALYRLKDAIKDRIFQKQKREIQINTENPDILLLLRSFKEEALIQISLSTSSLHKRGYRLETLEAPIRETLAQALLYFSGWNPSKLLIDPMCGSGTILIEAALYIKECGYLNKRILENSYIFKKLFSNDKFSLSSFSVPKIYGFDINPKAIELTKENARRAGVLEMLHLEVQDFLSLKGSEFPETGLIVSNPPYGVRLSNKEELQVFYKKIGENLKQNFSKFSFTIICGDKSLLGYFKLKSEKEKNLSIAKLKGKFVKYNIL